MDTETKLKELLVKLQKLHDTLTELKAKQAGVKLELAKTQAAANELRQKAESRNGKRERD